MRVITLQQNRRILFGFGVSESIGVEAGRFGDRALIVAGRTAMRKAGILQRVQDNLLRAIPSVTLFDKVESDPSLDTVEEGAALARAARCNVVVALGGGSALDAGKAIGALAGQPESLRTYFAGQAKMTAPGLPIIAVPTTAGTGAETTVNAVLSDTQAGIKKSVRSESMLPQVALVDPGLTMELPREPTVFSGMDALTQAVECYLTRAAHAVSDALSLQAATLLYGALPLVVEDGANKSAREKMMLGSTMAGMAFSNAALGAAHGLSHPLGARLHRAHGFLCGVMLPEVLELNKDCDFRDYAGRRTREKLDTLAAALGFSSADSLIDGLRALRQQVGLPSSLAGCGLKSGLFRTVAAECRSSSMVNNPRELTDDDIARFLATLA
jgi:alcohol dehydrogenase class IV